MRVAAIAALIFAGWTLGACRARLPVERTPAPTLEEPAAHLPGPLARYLRGESDREVRPNDPTRPFLAEADTDRIRDMVRLPWHPGEGPRLLGFRFEADNCVPHVPRR